MDLSQPFNHRGGFQHRLVGAEVLKVGLFNLPWVADLLLGQRQTNDFRDDLREMNVLQAPRLGGRETHRLVYRVTAVLAINGRCHLADFNEVFVVGADLRKSFE